MADEKEVVETGADAGADSAEVTTGDEGAADAGVIDDGAAKPEGDESDAAEGKDAKPVVNPWEGVSWRHRQAAERAKRDATWAKAAGPDVLDGLADMQDEISRDWAAAGRKQAEAKPEDATPVKPAATVVKAAPGEAAGEFAFDAEELATWNDEFREGFVKAVANPLQERIRKYDTMAAKVEKLSVMAERLEKAEQAQQVQHTVELLKGFVNTPEIAAEFGDVYGNGDLSTMKEGDPQAQALGELYINADAIFRRAAELGRPISEKEALTRANSFLQSDRIRANEREKGRKEAEKVRRTATHRPATRTAPPVEDDEKKNEAETLSWLKTQTRKIGAVFSG